MSSTVRIASYERLPELWEARLAPWFAARDGLPPPGTPPAIVLAPDVTRLGWLKRSWLETGGGPLFGLQFWTPGQLRRHLLRHHFPDLRLATAEDLALAARLVLADEREDTPLGVVAENPEGFLRAWDAWLAARGEAILFASPWQRLPGRLARQLREVALVNVREADARLAALPPPERPVLGPLLVDGFSAAQAGLFPLLRAGLSQASSGLLTVALPRERRLEQVWLGTFERAFAAEAEFAVGAESASEPPFAAWAQRAEQSIVVAEQPSGTSFRLFETRRDEVGAIVSQVCDWLAAAAESDSAVHLGVVLPAEPFLIRAVSAGLLEAGVAVHDSFGFFPLPSRQERLFAAWVGYQRSGRLVEADALLEASIDAARFDDAQASKIRRAWREARERTLSDDLGVLTALLRDLPGILPGAEAAVEWTRSWVRLPENGTLALFLELCAPVFAHWEGEREFAEAREGWLKTWGRLDRVLAREQFLEWLWSSLRRPGRARHPQARDTFAPVQLVSYEMVRSAAWSHLLLAGLNERLVPPGSREEAFLLPDAAHRHLTQNLVEGPSGAGQEALADGAGFLLEDADRRALLGGALFDAVAETSTAVALTATYAPEGSDRSAAVISEYFQRLFRAAMGEAASLPPVENGTALKPAPSKGSTTTEELPLAATGHAYARRFDPTTPFDEYSFGFARPPSEPLELGARDWEAVLKRPATIWLQAIARVRPREDFSVPAQLPLVRGSAIHRLLRRGGGPTWHVLADETATWAERVERAAERWRRNVEQAHALADRPISLLWLEQWGQARTLARRLAVTVGHTPPLPAMASEYSLPEGARWVLPAGGELRLRGRVDALLVDDPETPRQALVIDFKTGGDTALKPAKVRQGDGLQLVLYGGALADLWQCPVALCLLKPGDSDVAAQMTMAPGEDPSGILDGLVALGARGVLGFAGAVRSDYAFVGEYPIAFVAPPVEVVSEKWIQTHPKLELPKGTMS